MTTPPRRHHQRQQLQQRSTIYNIFIISLFLLINNINSFHIPSHHQRTTTTIHPFITSLHSLPSSRQQQQQHIISQSPPTIINNQKKRTKTSLYSLSKLLSEIKTKEQTTPRVIFVGGKGGVGKTTISSALAVSLASSIDNVNDENILIVSTDPAHSLGDALDVDLRSSEGEPVVLTDPLTGGRLSACELDPLKALDSFRSQLDAFDIDTLADALGVSASFLETLGLREFTNLLNNPPPGLDELVALAQILSPTSSLAASYDTIIIDTAPTGHTLRLLSLPTFLDSFLGKLVSLRAKLGGIAATLQKFVGGGNQDAERRTRQWEMAVERLEELKKSMSILRESLKDGEKTSFMVVTVATALGVAESVRLMAELKGQGVRVTDVVVNQLMDNQDDDLMKTYYTRRQSGQQKWIASIRDAMADVSASEEYQRNNSGAGASSPMALIEVPYFDVELVGVAALDYVGRTCFSDNDAFRHLMEDSGSDDEPKFIICGGKGGVGKTTTSATLAVTLANANHNVALVSTDPAHSLGDALDTSLAGGNLTPIPLSSSTSTGSLTALEIDPAQSLQKFKSLVDSLIPSSLTSSSDEQAKLSATLSDLGSLFDTLPAGTDEVVALAQIVSILKQKSFDRIVLDTAPTGHTLRMLTTPGFIAELIDRVIIIAEKINSNAMVNILVNSAVGAERREEVSSVAAAAKSALVDFQMKMYDLEDMLSDPRSTEFLIVTIPTELAVRESVRLLNDLTFDSEDVPVKVRSVVVNQVLDESLVDVTSWGQRVKGGQERSVSELVRRVEGSEVEVTRVRYLDTEPRGVYGLKALEGELLEG